MSTFLSSVAVLLSTLALVCSGYTAYQLFALQKTLNTTPAGSGDAIAPKQTVSSPAMTTSSVPDISPTLASSHAAIQPGEFLQPAFGKKAQVELLAAKRIKDPQTGNHDVVALQMRIRRFAQNGVDPSESIEVFNTIARNPDTSETYKGVSSERSTGKVSLFSLRPQASADAYVWLRVPEDVQTIDIFVPDTAAFKGVPISS